MLSARAAVLGGAVILGIGICGSGVAAAAPSDYAALPVDPNHITDSSAYTAEPPVLDPDGQQGVMAVFTHRDGTRVITDTIIGLPSPQAATDALNQSRVGLAGELPGAATQPVPVGTDGAITSGLTADRSQSVAVLTFTQGDVFTTTRFQGPVGDPAPSDLITDYGRLQADAISAAGNA